MTGTDRKNMLPFTHDFIFGMVMRDREVCREFLRTVLPKENFKEIKLRMPENPLLSEEWEEEKDFDAEKMAVEIQKSLKFEHGRRGVRFDAYADTPEQSAAIEMQTLLRCGKPLAIERRCLYNGLKYSVHAGESAGGAEGSL